MGGAYIAFLWFSFLITFYQVAINKQPVDWHRRTLIATKFLAPASHCLGLSINLGMLWIVFYPPSKHWIPTRFRFDDAYITWVNEVRAWTLYSAGLAPDSAVEIGRRIVPVEPMVNRPYLIIFGRHVLTPFSSISSLILEFPKDLESLIPIWSYLP